MIAEGYYWARFRNGNQEPVEVIHAQVGYGWEKGLPRIQPDVWIHGEVWVFGHEYSDSAIDLGIVDLIPLVPPA